MLDADGLGPGALALALLLALVLIFSRRPGDLLHAQFYAEDGSRWFAQAYNGGWLRSLLIPDASYLQLLPRLVAGLALLVPLRSVPLLMNCAGALVQALPVCFLLSARARTWGSLRTRLLLAAVYLANPNASEVHVVLTNAQWHLALLQLLVAFAAPPRTGLGRAGDLALFVLGSVSGPFDIVLLPLLLVFWWVRRERWSLVLAGATVPGVLLQLHSIATGVRTPIAFLGANFALLTRIVGGDVVANSLLGQSSFATDKPLLLNLLALLLGIVVVALALRRGPLGLRLFAVYTAVWLAGALKRPMIISHQALWPSLVHYVGGRYYYFPTLLFLWCLVYCAGLLPVRALRVGAMAVLALGLVGVVRKWELPPFGDHGFAEAAARFEQAQPGEHVVFPIYPEGWQVDLRKHADISQGR